jgi:hypothetical protein
MEDFMPGKIKSISARQLSSEVQAAVRKAISGNAALKGTPVQPKFMMSPWLLAYGGPADAIARKDAQRAAVVRRSLRGTIIRTSA